MISPSSNLEDAEVLKGNVVYGSESKLHVKGESVLLKILAP